MIVLNVMCIAGHRFEGWFASVEAFDEQLCRQQVNCPCCNSTEVSRLPSGPNIVKGSTSLPPEQDASISEEQMMDIIQRLVDGSEDVGERFVEEARRIHYDEAPARQIKGIATLAETRDLIEEGIAVVPLGVPRKGETH